MNSTTPHSQGVALDPAPLMQMSFSFAASRILATAVQLRHFFAYRGRRRHGARNRASGPGFREGTRNGDWTRCAVSNC